jgi:ABC-type nitrate/sulfonate/bicarbonate transport system substrate-binding protein
MIRTDRGSAGPPGALERNTSSPGEKLQGKKMARIRGLRRQLFIGRVLITLFFLTLAGMSIAAQRLGYVDRLAERIRGRSPRLAAGDFPAGVMAPVEDLVKVPLRPMVVGMVPRGSEAPLLVAAGGPGRVGLFRAGYAIDVRIERFVREDELRKALVRGAEAGGIDLAAMPVSSLAMSASLLRDTAPRVVLLLGRSRGQDVVAARPPLTSLTHLAGRRIGVEVRSAAWYVLLWSLSRSSLALKDVELLPLESSFEAGEALRSGKVDAVAGFSGDVAPVTKELGGSILTTTADAPHLVATVLVARGDFAARYPDGIRRLLRGVLDANAAVLRDTTEAARLLGTVAPQLGDPTEAIAAAPPASLKENLAFFGLKEEAPVTFHELFQSAASLNTKLFDAPPAPQPEDVADLSALKYISSTAGRQ